MLPARDVAPSIERDDDDEQFASTPDPVGPPVVAPPLPRTAPTRPAAGVGAQRYGEAVVRQVLGATFVREEPYQQPTRFN